MRMPAATVVYLQPVGRLPTHPASCPLPLVTRPLPLIPHLCSAGQARVVRTATGTLQSLATRACMGTLRHESFGEQTRSTGLLPWYWQRLSAGPEEGQRRG